MKQQIRKLFAVPSVRTAAVGVASLGALVASGVSSAAGMADGAVTAIQGAQADGTTVGTAVVGVVAALCVVGIVISMIRKV